MTAQEEFQMEQYRTLRTEIENNNNEIRSLQRNAVIAVAVVWAWIATNPAPAWAAFLPLAFVFLGVLQMQRILRETRDMGLFIGGSIEPFFKDPANSQGSFWENWLREIKPRERTRWFQSRSHQAGRLHHNPLASLPVWAMWVLLTVAILCVGWLQLEHPFAAPAKAARCSCTG